MNGKPELADAGNRELHHKSSSPFALAVEVKSLC